MKCEIVPLDRDNDLRNNLELRSRVKGPAGVAAISIVLTLAQFFANVGMAAETISSSLSGPSNGEVTIEVGYLSLVDRDAILKDVNALEWFRQETSNFMAAHPGIVVNLLEPTKPLIVFDGTDNTLATSIEEFDFRIPRGDARVKLPRNIVCIDNRFGDHTALLVHRDAIVPIEKFLPDDQLSLSLFSANLLKPIQFRSQHWGVPWMGSSTWLVCNWPVFEAAGISELPRTWDQFFSFAERLTKDLDGDGKIDQWGFAMEKLSGGLRRTWFHFFVTQILQKRGHIIQDGKFTFEHPACQESLDYLLRLNNSGYVYNSNGSKGISDGQFAKRKPWAMVFRHIDERPVYLLNKTGGGTNRRKSEAVYQRYAKLPTWGKRVHAGDNMRYLAICRSTPQEELASWEFVKWMASADVSPSGGWYGYPCRNDLVDRTQYRLDEEEFGTPWHGGDTDKNRIKLKKLYCQMGGFDEYDQNGNGYLDEWESKRANNPGLSQDAMQKWASTIFEGFDEDRDWILSPQEWQETGLPNLKKEYAEAFNLIRKRELEGAALQDALVPEYLSAEYTSLSVAEKQNMHVVFSSMEDSVDWGPQLWNRRLGLCTLAKAFDLVMEGKMSFEDFKHKATQVANGLVSPVSSDYPTAGQDWAFGEESYDLFLNKTDVGMVSSQDEYMLSGEAYLQNRKWTLEISETIWELRKQLRYRRP